MHTLLFDIDGTLIRSGGAGFHAMRIALAEMFGISDMPSVEVHGRTDRGILTDLFHRIDQDFDQHIAQFSDLYWRYLPDSLHETNGFVLPGVNDLLLRLSTMPEFALGILTGNARRAAEIKLEHFQLAEFFDFGGHGDDHACRTEVAKLAHRSAADFLTERFDEQHVWVIGDTIHDIRCGREIGAKVIAVETGGGDSQQLKNANPDAQFATLEHFPAFLKIFESA